MVSRREGRGGTTPARGTVLPRVYYSIGAFPRQINSPQPFFPSGLPVGSPELTLPMMTKAISMHTVQKRKMPR